jgi:hypothetical protein
MMFLCVVTPCRFIGRYHCFRETYCLHLQGWIGNVGKYIGSGGRKATGNGPVRVEEWGEMVQANRESLHFPALLLQPWRWRQYVSPKCRYQPMNLHSVSTQKNNTVIRTTMRTSNLTFCYIALFVRYWLLRG